MKKIVIATLCLLGIFITGCSQQQARRPVSHTSGSFMKESINRNKKLVASEEAIIDSIIKSNPQIKFFASDKGYWYHYEIDVPNDTIRPKRGDVAYFDYEVKDLNGNVIYSEMELKPQVYYVDKENIMMGLRDGIKLMNEGEKVTFLFPSNMGYGYHGDNNKIGVNQPIACTVTLHDIKQENEVQD